MEKELLKLYESLDDEKCKDLFARQLIICHRHMHMHMDDMWGLIGDALRGLTCNGYCPEPSKPGAEKPTEPEQSNPQNLELSNQRNQELSNQRNQELRNLQNLERNSHLQKNLHQTSLRQTHLQRVTELAVKMEIPDITRVLISSEEIFEDI
ncbi:MPPV-098 conserved hypothetical protein [Magpiepox virus 2]|nr:MPPV-098 conserved hypothetical protein [Magpiepox virus 2]